MKCCCQPGCIHPLCQKKVSDPSASILSTWYPNGPSVSILPLPILDAQRVWGQTDCPDCVGFCHGHYLKLTDNVTEKEEFIATPPSIVISDFFHRNRRRFGMTEVVGDALQACNYSVRLFLRVSAALAAPLCRLLCTSNRCCNQIFTSWGRRSTFFASCSTSQSGSVECATDNTRKKQMLKNTGLVVRIVIAGFIGNVLT